MKTAHVATIAASLLAISLTLQAQDTARKPATTPTPAEMRMKTDAEKKAETKFNNDMPEVSKKLDPETKKMREEFKNDDMGSGAYEPGQVRKITYTDANGKNMVRYFEVQKDEKGARKLSEVSGPGGKAMPYKKNADATNASNAAMDSDYDWLMTEMGFSRMKPEGTMPTENSITGIDSQTYYMGANTIMLTTPKDGMKDDAKRADRTATDSKGRRLISNEVWIRDDAGNWTSKNALGTSTDRDRPMGNHIPPPDNNKMEMEKPHNRDMDQNKTTNNNQMDKDTKNAEK